MASDQVRLDLLGGIKGNTDNDQQGCPSKIKRDTVLCDQDIGQYANSREIDGSREGDSGKHKADVLGGSFSGTVSGDIAAVFLDIVCDVGRIKRDGSIKVSKENGESDIDAVVEKTIKSQVIGNRFKNRKPLGNSGGEHQDRRRKDRGDNTSGIDFERQVRCLAACDLVSDDAFGVLNWDTSVCAFKKDDHTDNDDHKGNEKKKFDELFGEHIDS